MSYLILAIFASVSVSIFLKLVRVQNIDVRQSILINYMTAIFLALLFLKPDFSQGLPKFGTAPSFIFIALGVLCFYHYGKSGRPRWYCQIRRCPTIGFVLTNYRFFYNI